MEYSYPILNKVFNYYAQNKIDVSSFRIYSCQHLLEPQLEMYKMFVAFGFKPENIFALGKAYSSNSEIIKELADLGINVFQPTFSGVSFDVEHAINCGLLATLLSDKDKNIILDDGGYLIHEMKNRQVDFAVEQTSSGFRKLDGVKLDFPVVNVARSRTKLEKESPIIAKIVHERIIAYIGANNIISPKFLIIGLGPIGNATLQILSCENFSIKGFDVNVSKKDMLMYLKNDKPDIIIGATGTSIFDASDLSSLGGEHVYHFLSISSSDREFPVASFRDGNNKKVHNDVVYKNFVFVNNGFPITFLGLKYESTPAEMEKTIALLMGSVLHGATRGFGGGEGLIDVPKELEDLINE